MRKGIVVCVLLTALMLIPVTIVSALPITSVITIDGNTISVTYTTSSSVVSIDPSTPDYNTEDGSVTYGGIEYDMIAISSNDNANGGIADSDGNVNVALSIPENTPFVIRIYNGENYRIVTYVDIDNVILNGQSGSHSYGANTQLSGYNRYLCHYYEEYSNKTYEYWNTSNWSKVISNNGWFYSDNGVVDISITAHYDDGSGRTAQNVFLYVILKND